jgi:membrane protease YdiL (CAAX protease family)
MPVRPPSQLRVFLLATLAISWTSWWGLAWGAGSAATTYGAPAFMAAYVFGGLGPTIAAYAAVLASGGRSALREFHQRLVRWRFGVRWWAAALGVPLALALGARWVGEAALPGEGGGPAPEPWARVLDLFPLMVLGGGLEELGWRGVAQPELERRLPRLQAAAVVGAVWAVWHLPLFAIEGLPQHGQGFPVFAVEVLGSAFLLAWLCAGAGSVLPCVVFHAAQNTLATMGYGLPAGQDDLRLGIASVKLLLGVALLASSASGRAGHRMDHAAG